MTDQTSVAILKAAIAAVLNNSVPDESIEPDDHNTLLDDLLDTITGLDKVLRHNNATGGFNLQISDGDLLKIENGSFTGDFDTQTLTGFQTYTFQDASGVVAFLSDLPTVISLHSGLTLDDGTNPHGTTKTDVGLSNVPNTDFTTPVANNTAKVSADGSIDTHSDVDTTTIPPVLNDVLKWDGANFVPAVSGGSGSFALFDSAGVPTFYTTLALVIAAASAGDTIQQFGNITETVSSNALPVDVNWNLNGFTYEKTSGSYAVSIAVNSTNRITNGRIFANGSGNCIDAPSANEDLYCDGLILQSTAEAIRANLNVNIHNVTIIGNSSTLPVVNGGNYHNSTLKGTGSARTTDLCQDLTDCEITSDSSNAVYRLGGKAYDCRIHSSGSTACSGANFRGVGCTITSSASHAVNVTNVEVEDCFIDGQAETGITSSSGFAIGCTVKGVSIDFAFRTVMGTQKVERCTIVNSAGRGIDRGANSETINSVIRSTFNSVNGDAIRVDIGLIAGVAPVIANCSVEVVNTSANYLYASNATVANYANVVSTDKLAVVTPVHANITQGNAASDTEGNNF